MATEARNNAIGDHDKFDSRLMISGMDIPLNTVNSARKLCISVCNKPFRAAVDALDVVFDGN